MTIVISSYTIEEGRAKGLIDVFLRAKADGRVTYDFDIDGLFTMIKSMGRIPKRFKEVCVG